MISRSDVTIVVFAYNRPDKTRNTLVSLGRALEYLRYRDASSETPQLVVAVDGPKRAPGDVERVHDVVEVARELLPATQIWQSSVNRSLPSHLTQTLDRVFSDSSVAIALCVEDDVELSPAGVSALLYASRQMTHAGFVIGAAPQHRDGSLEHQTLLIDRRAHEVSSSLLKSYIATFSLDGAEREGGYGQRDHDAIARWSGEIARAAGVSDPKGTSQDRIRELAWKREGVRLVGLPMRLVKHRGYWGQHNTPWYALRTGQLFQRLDRRPWELIEEEIRAALQQT